MAALGRLGRRAGCSAMFPDHYRALGVAPDARPEAIRRHYRRLAACCHPDLCAPAGRAAAERRMKAINAAYAVLRDPSLRAAYDAERARCMPPPSPVRRTPAHSAVRVRLARPPRREGLPRWAFTWGLAALVAAALWSRGDIVTDAVKAGLIPRPAPTRDSAARALERFIAAYHAGDIAGAAQVLDAEPVRIVLANQSGQGAARREITCDDAAAARRLLAAGFEARRRGSASHDGDGALLSRLGGLAGGVEFQCVWGPAGPFSPPVASACGRYYVLTPTREVLPARAVFTLRRHTDGWKISAIVLSPPADDLRSRT